MNQQRLRESGQSRRSVAVARRRVRRCAVRICLLADLAATSTVPAGPSSRLLLVTATCAAAAHHQAAKFRVLFALLSTLHQPSGTGFRSSARHSFGRFVLQRTTGPRQGVLPLIASVCDELLPGLILSDRVAPCEQPANRPCGGETQKDGT